MSLLLLLASCSTTPRLTVTAPAELEAALTAFLAPLAPLSLSLETAEDPRPAGPGLAVAVRLDRDCAQCFELEAEGWEVTVHAGDVLGAQYGLATVLEAAGVGPYHPYAFHVPERLSAPEGLPVGLQQPETARRGIHLHTLHPIEGYFDFWEPGAESLERAGQVINWVVWNRGNHLQWVALDDIQRSPTRLAAWQDHTGQLLEQLHTQGLSAGLGVQLFGSGNLQQAWDLLDEVGSPEQQQAELEARLQPVFGALDFDVLSLSFGEFFGEDPPTFIGTVNRAYDQTQQTAPGLEVVATIHVGDDLQVEHQGQEMIYYFLVQFADPAIVPWIHTVMYYNLFEDPGGAYHHEDFDQHRAFLLDKLDAGEPVGYHPESAYWIAFDDSIPTYLPLYMKSRWHDLDQLRQQAATPLQDHVLFSSGWEWGYWQTDAAVLRMNWQLPARWIDPLAALLAPHGEAGEAAAAQVEALGELQHRWLLEGRLAAYFASYDNIMELGYGLDILSQPKRVLPEELAELSAEQRSAFEQTTLADLAAFAGDTEAVHAALQDLAGQHPALATDPFLLEIADGVAIDALRARYIERIYAGMVAGLEGQPTTALDEADALLTRAREVVDRRHAALHDPQGERLLREGPNSTIYQYGYLIRAEQLCYWERERVLARNLVDGGAELPPGCGL